MRLVGRQGEHRALGCGLARDLLRMNRAQGCHTNEASQQNPIQCSQRIMFYLGHPMNKYSTGVACIKAKNRRLWSNARR